jgi:hypothetical protein
MARERNPMSKAVKECWVNEFSGYLNDAKANGGETVAVPIECARAIEQILKEKANG